MGPPDRMPYQDNAHHQPDNQRHLHHMRPPIPKGQEAQLDRHGDLVHICGPARTGGQ